MNFELDYAWLQAVLLASVRMAGFIIIAPPFSHSAFPGRVKAMLAVGLGLAVSPRVADGFTALASVDLLLAIVAELLTGTLLGFLVYLVFAAIQGAGNLVDLFGGFQIAQGFDPGMNIMGAQFSRLFNMVAIALIFTTGAYQLILGGLARTFDGIPAGGHIDLNAAAEMMVQGVTETFLAAVQIAGPLAVILFLADAGLGLLTRVAPAMNAFSMGFPLKILLTLTLAGVLIATLPEIVGSLTEKTVRLMLGVS